jgi:hypothetical protein
VLLVTALAQAGSPLLVPFDGRVDADPVVVPPGPFFSIWAVITLGCLAAALWGLPLHRAQRAPYDRIQLPLSVAQVGFVAWLLAADRVPALTLPVFLLMLAALAPSLRTVVRTPADRGTRLLLGGSLGLYTGWTTAAVWLNAATLLPGAAAADTTVLAALLAGAVVTGALGARTFDGQAAYVLAAGWALLGVLVSTARAGAVSLSAVAALGLAAVTGAAALAQRRTRRPAGRQV